MLIVCMYGIVYYDYRTGRIADAGYDFGGYQNNVTINNATFDHEGNLYISTSEHGVLMIRKGSNRVEQLENSNSSFNLATAFVNEIIEDKDNNLWIGCYNKGLYLSGYFCLLQNRDHILQYPAGYRHCDFLP